MAKHRQARHRGVGNCSWSKPWAAPGLGGHYTWLDRDNRSGNPVTDTPRHKLFAYLNWKPSERWDAQLSVDAEHGRVVAYGGGNAASHHLPRALPWPTSSWAICHANVRLEAGGEQSVRRQLSVERRYPCRGGCGSAGCISLSAADQAARRLPGPVVWPGSLRGLGERRRATPLLPTRPAPDAPQPELNLSGEMPCPFHLPPPSGPIAWRRCAGAGRLGAVAACRGRDITVLTAYPMPWCRVWKRLSSGRFALPAAHGWRMPHDAGPYLLGPAGMAWTYWSASPTPIEGCLTWKALNVDFTGLPARLGGRLRDADGYTASETTAGYGFVLNPTRLAALNLAPSGKSWPRRPRRPALAANPMEVGCPGAGGHSIAILRHTGSLVERHAANGDFIGHRRRFCLRKKSPAGAGHWPRLLLSPPSPMARPVLFTAPGAASAHSYRHHRQQPTRRRARFCPLCAVGRRPGADPPRISASCRCARPMAAARRPTRLPWPTVAVIATMAPVMPLRLVAAAFPPCAGANYVQATRHSGQVAAAGVRH